MQLPLLIERICPHRGACLTCRSTSPAGEDWRRAIVKAFVVPPPAEGDAPERFVCPFGAAWDATAPPPKTARSAAQRPAGGVGTEIKKLLARWGIKDKGCKSCETLAAEWDRRGAAWCESHTDEIVATLQQRAKLRGWLLGVGAMLGARAIVEQAIANVKVTPAGSY